LIFEEKDEPDTTNSVEDT